VGKNEERLLMSIPGEQRKNPKWELKWGWGEVKPYSREGEKRKEYTLTVV